jgi:hypothetical protein
VIAGLTGIAFMVAADASAQDCPGWLKWACPTSASANAVARDVRQEKQRSRGKASSRSAVDSATTPKSKQTEAAEPAPPAKAVRHTRSGDPSRDRRLAGYGERQGTRVDPAMNDHEKEMLFQQFLEWQQARRLNAEATR